MKTIEIIKQTAATPKDNNLNNSLFNACDYYCSRTGNYENKPYWPSDASNIFEGENVNLAADDFVFTSCDGFHAYKNLYDYIKAEIGWKQLEEFLRYEMLLTAVAKGVYEIDDEY